jgi:ElaB/YqjD/DUF883 family membrane-anchored ribosome-binding protein
MPPRNPELPEGTDHIINGAMETGAGADASMGSSGTGTGGGSGSGAFGGASDGGTGFGGASAGGGMSSGAGMTGGASTGGGSAGGGSAGGTAGGGASSGFIGSGDVAVLGDDTGGTASGSSGGGTAPVKQQLREGASSLKGQATDKIRGYAEDGKARATSALEDFSNVVNEAAQSIDERLGAEYGNYARRAATAVSGVADTLRTREVDELFDDARNVIRKSPALAIGAAAAVGFALVRLIKSGMPEDQQREVEFTPESGTTGNRPSAPVIGSTTHTGA